MAKCIFCIKRANSREHVLPAWSYDVPADHRLMIVRRDTGPEKASTHWLADSAAGGVQARVVCTTCNNGWMSKLENSCKPLVARLNAWGTVTLSFDEQRLLSRWALKTAIVAEHVGLESRHHFAQEQREMFASYPNGLLSNTVVTAIAHHGLPQLSVGIGHFRFLLDSNPFGLTSLPALVVSFNIQNVGFQVLAWRNDKPTPERERPLVVRLTSTGDWSKTELRLWPNNSLTGLTWSPTECLAGEVFASNYHERWMRKKADTKRAEPC